MSFGLSSNNAPTAEVVKQRLRPFGIFFEKSLKDLIKGIRSHNETPESLHTFLTNELVQCRKEANSSDINLKANAVLKLAYLEMYGFDMAWCNFHTLEVMSSESLQNKRVGYLAASQSFHRDPDILVLMTNLLKKDLKYAGKDDMVKVGIALNAISTIIITPSLARDIVDDLFLMLNSSHAYIRKKTIAVLLKVFLQYPEALRDNFDKFTMKLQDNDISVVSATVSAICELSKQNPWPFVPLSPLLYELLLTVDNNWIIIRLLKLFTNLSQVEPKLKYKLLPKIVELMDSTMATSVLYESVNCIVKGSMILEDDYNTANKCLQCLNKFCQSQDPNLRYISCTLFYKIGIVNSQFVSDYNDLILRLISDVDISIRSKALELLRGIVNENNLKLVVSTLLKQFVNEEVVILNNNGNGRGNGSRKEFPILIPNDYKIKMIRTIISLCSMENYRNVTDFEWLNALLIDLTIVSQDLIEARDELGKLIGLQLKSIMIKVPDVRNITISSIIKILTMYDIEFKLSTVLRDCIWSLGEYSSLIENGEVMIKILIDKSTRFNADIKAILIPSILKLLSTWCNSGNITLSEVKDVITIIIQFLNPLISNSLFEIQERSIEAVEFLNLVAQSIDELEVEQNESSTELPMLLTDVLPSFFGGNELRPIAKGTQQELQKNLTHDYLETPFLSSDDWNNLFKQYDIDEGCITESTLFDGSSDEKFSDRDTFYENDYSELSSNVEDKDNPFSNYNDDATIKNRKEEQLSNPFYLTESDDKANIQGNDIFEHQEYNSHVDELVTIVKVKNTITPSEHVAQSIESELITTSNKEQKKKHKKHKKLMKKVKVLDDEVIVQPDQSQLELESKKSRSLSPIPNLYSMKPRNNNGIFLQTKSKLGSFNFNKDEINDLNVIESEQLELDKIRQRFQEQSLEDQSTMNDGDEEVIIIKKKRDKSKKKSKTKKKSKSKDEIKQIEADPAGAIEDK
ncbi:hypothetical protein RI543_003586 [Arxiozyma heterogenica]|uniref:AP-3 complex subunit delta n=1 Tax=Arxiozyma heterogenica TaxID=278026 RepID=A0AAN8A6M7_9SACH|nr:hypothetical protein RI543_003586 [Kazachstania heterogenica]